MAGLRSYMIRGGALISFVVVFAACSEKATCALEGCTKENKVELKDDSSAANNALDAQADASKAEKEAIEKAIKDIKDRMELGESIDKVQNDMLHIHETRLAALELKITQIDASIVSLNSKIADAEAAILANKNKIDEVKADLEAAIAAGDTALKADLEAQLAEHAQQEAGLRAALEARVALLEAFKVAQEAANSVVDGKLSSLQSSVDNILARLAVVEGKVDGSISSGLYSLIQTVQQSVSAAHAAIGYQTNLLSQTLIKLGATTGPNDLPNIVQMKNDLLALKGSYDAFVLDGLFTRLA